LPECQEEREARSIRGVYQTMSVKSKQYTIDEDKFIELMKREQDRPTAQEWREAIGMPERTFFNKLKKKEVSA